jgi:tetratricopeptide (TPR) repeat protein
VLGQKQILKRKREAAVLVTAALCLACASGPPDPGLRYRQEAEASLAEGSPGEAVAAYRLALYVAPADLLARRGLLRAQVTARDGEAALRTLDSLVTRDPEPVDPCPTLALVVAERLGRAGDAETPAQRSAEAGCSGSASQLARVLAHESGVSATAGDRDAAIVQLGRAIELDSGNPDYYQAAAELLIAEGRSGEAVALLASGLEHHPHDRSLRDLMVRALSVR